MARLFHAGAEIDAGASTAAQNTGPDGQKGNTGTLTRDTSVFRSGAASWKFDSTASNLSVNVGFPLTFTADTYFLRAYVLCGSAPTLANKIAWFDVVNAGPAARLRTDGAVELFAGSAAQGSPSVNICDGNWHRVEVKATNSGTAWTAAELLVDGTSIATWSGSSANSLSGFLIGWFGAPGASKTINIDDVALNDSTGASNNSYPGAGNVVLLKPTADSAVGTGWTNDNAAATGLFSSVSATPPAGIADTTAGGGGHQIRNATSNASVNYDARMTTYTAAGIGATDTVNAVQEVVATAAPVTTSSKAGTFGIVSNPTVANVALGATGTSGAFWAGLAAGTYGAGWKWSIGAVQNAPTVTVGSAPVARVTQTTSSTRIAMVCSMFIYVDYTPAVITTPVVPSVIMAPYTPA